MDTKPSEKVSSVCGEIVLNDAKRWYKTNYPRIYMRLPGTQKSMVAATRREIDDMYAEWNREWDESLMEWYERAAERYGVVRKLPWIGKETK